MNWPASTSEAHEVAEDVAPGVARVRPWLLEGLFPQGDGFKRAPSRGRTEDAAPRTDVTRRGAGAGGHSARATALDKLAAGNGIAARQAYLGPQPAPGVGAASRPAAGNAAAANVEETLAPLRGISRELIARGMPTALVSELFSEILAEYGNQVLESERNARLALVEQLLLRVPAAPLFEEGERPRGTVVVSGPAGAGKSVFIGHLAMEAARRGQADVVLVNTDNTRIGAAAQMLALGAVFGFGVEHLYTPQEVRQLGSRRGPEALVLVETAGWSPRDEANRPGRAGVGRAAPDCWKWHSTSARSVVCMPATAHLDDAQALLATARERTTHTHAVLSKATETRNVLPALGALALARQPVSMVVPGPDLAAAEPIDLGDMVRSALGVVTPRARKGRVR